MKLDDLEDKKILILGLGREGLSVLNFLSKHFPSKKISIADQKKIDIDNQNIDKAYFGKEYLEHLDEYDVIIKSPGIPPLKEIEETKKSGKIVTSLTSIFFENCKGKIIGITGTKGKSTTTSLVYEVLKNGEQDVYLVGNIGIPALDLLEKGNGSSIFVYELSSYQLADLNKSPHIAVITNIYQEHLDWHGSFTDYINAKANITKYQTNADHLIYNEDIPQVQEIAKDSLAIKHPFSKYKTLDILKDIDLKLLAKFNLENVGPAYIVGRIYEIPDQKIKAAIVKFQPLPHRIEYVKSDNTKGIEFYNDSLATIPEATISALEILGDDVETLIVGGYDRGIDYTKLGIFVARSNIKNLILFPITGEKIWQAVVDSENTSIKKFDANSMQEAVKLAFEKTSPGKICLLSPASSSFNMFKDYADRGEQFKKYINILKS